MGNKKLPSSGQEEPSVYCIVQVPSTQIALVVHGFESFGQDVPFGRFEGSQTPLEQFPTTQGLLGVKVQLIPL